jgi:hypothetical protein
VASAGDDARALLRVPPDQYIAERTRLVKEARSLKDRERAAYLQGLKKPNLAMWAALVAGDDAASVRRVLEATSQLASVQGGGAGRNELAAATRHRRDVVEAMVNRAVAALASAESKSSAELRRSEIRTVIDQLSRHPESAEAWVDGSLRDLPEEGFGFGAFADVEPREVEPAPRAAKNAAQKAAKGRSPDGQRSRRAPEKEPSRSIDLKAEREAQRAVSVAERELATAERRLRDARDTAARAQEQVEAQQHEHDKALRAFESAQARLAALRP